MCKILFEFIRIKTSNAIYRILNKKGIIYNKTFTLTDGVGPISGFVQLGHNVKTIIGSGSF